MAGTGQSARKLTLDDIRAAAERLKNWGRWGANDEIGTLNFTRPEDIVAAAQLVRKGRVFSLALPYDQHGPQGGKTKYPAMGRFNPIHLMLRTGTDAYSGVLDSRKIRGSDDVIIMPTQAGTQWDGLGHIFYGDHMWNGYDCRTVTSAGAQKCGIEKTADRMVGRGVLFDIPRMLGMEYLAGCFRRHQRSARPGRTALRREGGARRLPDRAHGTNGSDALGENVGRVLGRRRSGTGI